MKQNKLLNVEFTYEDGEKAFSYNLEVTKETEHYIYAVSNLYRDTYKLCKRTESLEINKKFVGLAHRWWTETI